MFLLEVVAVAVVFLLGVLPVIQHLWSGISERRQGVLENFDEHGAAKYFAQFFYTKWAERNPTAAATAASATTATAAGAPRAAAPPAAPEAAGAADGYFTAKLAELFESRFGVRAFLLPGLIYVVTLAIAVVFITASILKVTIITRIAEGDGVPAYAVAGAYLWIVSDLIHRFRLRDLVPGNLYEATFRLVISIPVGYAVTSVLNDTLAPTFAFLLGVFPTDTLFFIMRRTASERLKLGEEKDKPLHELVLLEGVNTTIAEKLSDIGIQTLSQLAHEDPIQLTMRTNLSFTCVVEIVSQAIAAQSIEPAKSKKYGLRGALQIASLYHELPSSATATAIVNGLAQDLGIVHDALIEILRGVATDPYTEFLDEVASFDAVCATAEPTAH